MLREETGGSDVRAVIDVAAMSAVNWSEVIQKLIARGVETAGLRDELEDLEMEMALAVRLDGKAVTADRSWARARSLAEIEVIR